MLSTYTKRFKIEFRYEILLLFVLFEVFLYDSQSLIQAGIAIIEYLFLFIVLFFNRRVGIMYFIAFTLLSMGAWSYVIQEELPNNFWGLRLFGFSFHFFFSFYVFLFSILKFGFVRSSKSPDSIFFNFLVLYSLFVGLLLVICSVNYVDNFVKDTGVYLPYFIYVYLLNILKEDELLKIVKQSFSLTVISMVVSFLTGKMFDYGEGFPFLLMNSFGFILIFSIFFLRPLYSKTHFWILFFTVMILFATGKVFMGGKAIIIFLITALWFGLNNRKAFALFLIIGGGLFFFGDLILTRFLDSDDSSALFTYKFTQIFDVFEIADFETIAGSNTSMANLFAEGHTLFTYLLQNPAVLLFGKGLGSGIPDLHGYLAPVAGPSTGYTQLDVIRNEFFRLHLPAYEVILKTGIIGFSIYVYLLIKSFRSKHIISFIYFILLFTVFFNSKEMMLMTLIFMKLSVHFYKIHKLKLAAKKISGSDILLPNPIISF